MKHNLFFGVQPSPYRIDLCNWLYNRLDCEVYHLEASEDGLAFAVDALRPEMQFEYRTYSGKVFSPKGFSFLKALLRERKPELVFVSEFSATAMLACLLKRFSRHPFRVISICDDSPFMLQGNDFSRRHASARRFVPHLLDNLVLDNPESVAWYRKRFGKGVYFPIMADENRFRAGLERALPLSGRLSEQYGLAGEKVFLYVGRLIPLKQVDFILRAYAPLKAEARLVIVGDGESLPSLRALDASLGTKALFVGRQSGDDLLAWYNLGDIHLLPSRVEAFGAVVDEALMAGLYSLVSDRAGAKSLIDSENGLVLPVEDPLVWTEAIRTLLPRIRKDGVRLKENRRSIRFGETVENVFLSL